MILEKIIKKFEEKYPKSIAKEWDNVGLLLGDRETDIKKVLVTLDVTSKAIDYAIDNDVNLIMSHHPMLFRPVKRILLEEPSGYKIIKAIQNNISIYAAHTNLDSAEEGLNEYVLSLLDLDFKYIYEYETNNEPIRYIELYKYTDIYEILEKVKEALEIDFARLIFDEYYNSKMIKKIAIVTGSGASYINEVCGKVDLLLTADVSHHEALDAMELGLAIIDFGHHDSESPSIEIISNFLEENTDVEVLKYRTNGVIKTI